MATPSITASRLPRVTSRIRSQPALLGCWLLLAAAAAHGADGQPANATAYTTDSYIAACHAAPDGVVAIELAPATELLKECSGATQGTPRGISVAWECSARVLENYVRTHPQRGFGRANLIRVASDLLFSPPFSYKADFPWRTHTPSAEQLATGVAAARTVAAQPPAPFDFTRAYADADAREASFAPTRNYWFARTVIAADSLLDLARQAFDKFYADGRALSLREQAKRFIDTRRGNDAYAFNTIGRAHLSDLLTGLALELTMSALKRADKEPEEAAADCRCAHELLYSIVLNNHPSRLDDQVMWLLTYPSKDGVVLRKDRAAFSKRQAAMVDAYARKDWLELGRKIAEAHIALNHVRDFDIEENAGFVPYCIAHFRAEQLTFIGKDVGALTASDLEHALTLAEVGALKVYTTQVLTQSEVDRIKVLASARLTTLRQHYLDGGFLAMASLVQNRLALVAPVEADDKLHAYLHERIAKRPRLTICLSQGKDWDGSVLGDTFLQDIAAFGSFYCPELAFTSDPAAARMVVIDQDTVNLVDPLVATTTERKIDSYLSGSIDMPVAVTSGRMDSSAVAAYMYDGYDGSGTVVMGHAAHAEIHTQIQHHGAAVTQNFAYSEKTVRMGVMAHVVLHITGGAQPVTAPCGIDNAAFDVVREGVPALSDLGNKPYTLGDWGSFLRGARQDLALKIVDAILATRPLAALGAATTDQEAEDLAIGLYARAYDWSTIATKVLPCLGAIVPRPGMPQISVGYTWTFPFAPVTPVATADLTGTYVVEGPGLRAAAIGIGEHGVVATVAPKGWNPVGGAIYLVRAVSDEGKPLATWPALLQRFDARKGVMAFGVMGQNGGLRAATFAAAPPTLDQMVVFGGFPDSTRTEAAILNQVRGKVASLGTATVRDDPIAGWTAKLSEPAPGTPSVLVACDAQGTVYGLGNVDAATATVSIAKPGVLKDVAHAADERQGGW